MRKVYILCNNTICGDVMGYRWSGRGRGLRLGYGRGLGPNLSPYRRWFPGMPGGWWANSAYSGMMPPSMWGQPYYSQRSPSYLPQQNTLPYQQMQPTQPVSYPQAFTSAPVHMNCAYFNNGVCTLRGASVPASGSACQSFIPKR